MNARGMPGRVGERRAGGADGAATADAASGLTPELRRWLEAPLTADHTIEVVGTAGGVGATTVAALLWSALLAVRAEPVGLADCGDGSTFARATARPTVPRRGAPLLRVVDSGRALPRTGDVLVVATPAHPAGLDAAAALLSAVDPGPVVIAASATVREASARQGRHHRHVLHRASAVPIVYLRHDSALAAGGRLLETLSLPSTARQDALQLAAHVLRACRVAEDG